MYGACVISPESLGCMTPEERKSVTIRKLITFEEKNLQTTATGLL